jgi:membrane protease YdiL (CAAX protease family)
MNSVSAVWQRIPVLVRATLTGLLVLFVGAGVWLGLLFGSRKLTASSPWAGGPMFLLLGVAFLWGYWRYLGGRGWPQRTAEARRALLRAHALPARVWVWALSAGVLAEIGNVALTFVWGRLIHLQPFALPDLSRYSNLTVLCLFLGIAVEAGVVEEAAFRGYMQVPLEKRYGPQVAIIVVSVVFGLVHIANGYRELTWLLADAVLGAILGTMAYLTKSILPGVVLHAANDAIRFLLVWRLGPNQPKTLIWDSGPDASFWISVAVVAIAGGVAIWTFRKLALVARPQSLLNT